METPVLESQVRDLARKAKYIRTDGLIPAVVYGKGQQNMHFTLEYQAFRRVFDKAGENTVIDLKVDGKTLSVLVNDVQYDPVSDAISHIDFVAIDMTKVVTTKVQVRLLGDSPAVKDLGGVLITHKHEITIKCLPKDLIHSIDVDVSGLVDFHHSIHVKDLIVPSKITVLDAPGDTVANVRPQKVEEEKPAVVPVEGAVPAEGAAPVESVIPGQDGAAASAKSAAPSAKGKEKKA
ncbi:MAG: 50S ribosomal protein L25 [Patescibacteria group bacterium]